MKRTMTINNLEKATIKLYISEYSKYDPEGRGGEIEAKYTGVTCWDVIEGGKEAAEIEANTDRYGIDENHEYLVLHFEDGTSSTFRNSHCDMFIE